MNFKQQLQEAYEAGYRSGLNEQPYRGVPRGPNAPEPNVPITNKNTLATLSTGSTRRPIIRRPDQEERLRALMGLAPFLLQRRPPLGDPPLMP